MIKSRGERIFNAINFVIMLLVGFVTLFPLWYVLMASISNGDAVVSGEVMFLPKGITLDSYREVVKIEHLWSSYLNAIFYTAVGTALSVVLTILAAYPTSKKRLVGGRYITFFLVFTMWFSAGTIPMYLNYKDLGLLDSRLGVILSGALTTFNIIVLRTYFENVPQSLEEAAKIDGADDFYTLIKLYIPLSVPSIITVMMYYMLARWNTYFWPMVLLKDEAKIPLQVFLRKLIVDMQGMEAFDDVEVFNMTKETVVYATIVVSIIPMLIVYPYVQKYFVKGMMVGAVKG